MNNEYTASDVIEVGKAQEVILGEKEGVEIDFPEPRLVTSTDLDD